MRKVRAYKVVYIIIAILFIVNTASVYMTENFNMCIAVISVVLVLYNIICIFMYKIKLSKAECLSAILISLVFLMLFIFWKHIYMYGVYVLGILFPNIWLMIKIQKEKNRFEEFLKAFVEVSVIIASCALFFWITGSTFGLLKPTGVVPISWGHNIRFVKSYYGLYFETQNAALDLGFVRFGVKNNAFFAEAPICAYIFIVAFIINEKIDLKKKKVIRILFFGMILSTLTTTGVLFATFMAVYFISKISFESRYGKVLKSFIYIIIIGIAAKLCFSILQDKVTAYSGNIRFLKIQNEFKAFLNAFIGGNGFNTYTDGSSNSITALLADGGILLWGIYYFPLIKVLLNKLRYRKMDSFLLVYILVFAITVVQYTPVCIFMILFLGENIIRGKKINDFNYSTYI